MTENKRLEQLGYEVRDRLSERARFVFDTTSPRDCLFAGCRTAEDIEETVRCIDLENKEED